ncbi:MAG: DNA repair protein RecN [Clostridiales bacterium]|nr:DNA repair protein RecN [Clostridiales bacterium]
MISRIYIKDFAIIKELEAEFFPGLSVVTGETGAGKSIVIEAMSMALAGRADKSMVRAGTERAVITLVTDGEDMPEVVSREIGAAGKSLCKADGEIVTLAQLEAFTTGHVDVHGQYDHQSLLVLDRHIGLLDAFGRAGIEPAAAGTAAAYAVYKDVKERLSELVRGAATAERELDFLRYEMKEIGDAHLAEGEDDELEARIKIMQSSEKIYEALANAYGLLSGESADGGSALSAVGGVRDSLSGLSGFDGEFAKMAEVSAEAYYALEELESQVRVARDAMEFSQADLDRALARLDRIDRLKAKYGGSIAAVLAHRDRAESRIGAAENSDALKAELEKELASARDVLMERARALSSLRCEAAARLEAAITEQLVDLSFRDAVFSVRLEPDEDAVSDAGFDRVEFMLSANKGQPLLPLAKVASGGELSRIMLAFKSVTGDFDGVETMIFDEIDSGISGHTASVVGEKLLHMAKDHQIICITHLPQIAAFADHHYMLEKHTEGDETFTRLREIRGEARVDEIARLVGGRSLTETARENARELIRQARG